MHITRDFILTPKIGYQLQSTNTNYSPFEDELSLKTKTISYILAAILKLKHNHLESLNYISEFATFWLRPLPWKRDAKQSKVTQ